MGSLQCIIRSAKRFIGNLPSFQELLASRTRRHAGTIVADPSHPGFSLGWSPVAVSCNPLTSPPPPTDTSHPC